jgi:hypothetical protein
MLNRAVGTISCRKLCFAATDFYDREDATAQRTDSINLSVVVSLRSFIVRMSWIWFRLCRVGYIPLRKRLSRKAAKSAKNKYRGNPLLLGGFARALLFYTDAFS